MNELYNLHQRFCDYSRVFKGNTPASIRWLQEAARNLFQFSEAKTLADLSQPVIEQWIIQGKLEKNWSEKTILVRLQAVSLFFDWCVKQNLIKNNPAKAIRKPTLPKRIPQHLSAEKAETLLDWTRNFSFEYKFERVRATAIIAMFIFTGIRLDEIRNLRMEAVDLRTKVLSIYQGKGRKDRLIPIPDRLATILETYLKDRRRLKKTCPYFFTAMRSDTGIGDRVIHRLVVRLRERSGIYFYPHMLRHTFAVLMLEGGCDLFSLSKMMGHSDIKTTTIYLYATTAHLKEQIQKHPLNLKST